MLFEDLFAHVCSFYARTIVITVQRFNAFWCFQTLSNNVVLSLSLWGQVISRVGDMVGIKYFPAEPTKQQQEKGMIKVD
jgi:hypothetical protein